jgi:pyruvate/2-oxoacid:ferredoxin oxidoreductase beta subunit
MTIEMVSNGYIVQVYDDEGLCVTNVIADKEDSVNESIEATQELLWRVLEWSGMSGSRYDKARLYVGLKVGDKYEGEDREALEKKYKEDAGID